MTAHDPPRRSVAAGYTAAIITGTSVGVTWAVQKYVLSQEILGPASLNWLNMIGLSVIVWPAYLIRFRRKAFGPGRPYGWLCLFALIAASIFYLRNVGVHVSGATTSAVVTRSEVVFIFLLSYFVLREPVGVLGWLGALVLVVGALRTAGLGSAELTVNFIGIAALVGSALGVALNAVIIKLHFSKCPNELVILASATVQTIVFSVIVPGTGKLHEVSAALGDTGLLGLAALGSVIIAAQLFAYYYAMKRAPMWAVRILALTGVPVATLLDRFALHSRVTSAQLEGLVAVLLGAVLVILSGRERANSGNTETRVTTAAGGKGDGDGR